MTSIEETGKTIEEATEKALEALGVTEDEVDIEILEEGTGGFLGLGRSPARIRVTPRQMPVAEAAPEPRRERPSRARTERPKPGPKPAPAPAPVAREEKPAPTPPPAPPQPAELPKPAPIAPQTGETMESAAEIGLGVLQHIADSIETGARSVVKSASDGQIVLEVTSTDPAAIIGRHGQTIDAIQYLVGVITNKRLMDKVRVVVDVEGYRSRREEALTNQALYLASKVKESGEEAVLEPLQANERRIIHTALADDPDVYTYSEGEDADRHVVISPRK